jgi:[ribosomal protein S18]-alanine N-acetyltransferase
MVVDRGRVPATTSVPGTVGRPPFADLRVRPMGRRHLGRVLMIERRVYPRPWSREVFEGELTRTIDRRYVVATGREVATGLTPRRVVGYGGVLVQVGEAHITTVAVDPTHHRRKVATHVLLALMEAARSLGAQAATLEARVANRGAQRLYAAFGFAPVGVRPGYYAETGEDALIMWVHDLQSPVYAGRLAEQRRRLSLPGGASGAADLHVPWVTGRVGLVGERDLPQRVVPPPQGTSRGAPDARRNG